MAFKATRNMPFILVLQKLSCNREPAVTIGDTRWQLSLLYFNASTGSIAPFSRQTLSTHFLDSLSRLTPDTAVASSPPDRHRGAWPISASLWEGGLGWWMRVGSPRRPLVSSRFGGKTQTSSRREGEWLKRADRSMSPPGDWELNWGYTRPFCQSQSSF